MAFHLLHIDLNPKMLQPFQAGQFHVVDVSTAPAKHRRWKRCSQAAARQLGERGYKVGEEVGEKIKRR